MLGVNSRKRGTLVRESRREAIIDVAQGVFLEEGFAATSMSNIATKLGGSKGTLYKYFDSKDELFEACVMRYCDHQADAVKSFIIDNMSLDAALHTFGRTCLTFLLSEKSLAMFRLVISEAERKPSIGKLFYECGMGSSMLRLADIIQDFMERGELDQNDKVEAASFFFALCVSPLMTANLFKVASTKNSHEIDKHVSASTRAFLCIFRAV